MPDLKILVVEGEAIAAETIASQLTAMGYAVAAIVATGAAAIERSAEADLVLMQVKLKGAMDGIEAAEQMQKQRSIPIIYLTENADESTLQRAKKSLSFGYLIKPFRAHELKAVIEIAWVRFQAEQELQQALALSDSLRQEAQNLSALRSQFVAMVSHEFRAPLTIIKVASEVLQHYQAQLSPDRQQRHFQRISDAIDNMNQLLEDVLMLGQTDIGKITCNPQPLDVVSFCQERVDAFQEATSCRLSLTSQIDCKEVSLDENLFRQLLNNLLSNALKYSQAEAIVTLRLFQQADWLGLEVQDQGIGIAPADLERLFEPFQRGVNVGRIPGTGLGLAIVKRAVDLHQGEISVSSEVGVGTTFTVMLPLQSDRTLKS